MLAPLKKEPIASTSHLNIAACESPGGSTWVICKQAGLRHRFASVEEVVRYCYIFGFAINNVEDDVEIVTNVYLSKAKEAQLDYYDLLSELNTCGGFLRKTCSSQLRLKLDTLKYKYLIMMLDAQIKKKEIVFLRSEHINSEQSQEGLSQELSAVENLISPEAKKMINVFRTIAEDEKTIINNPDKKTFYIELLKQLDTNTLSTSDKRLLKRILFYINNLDPES